MKLKDIYDDNLIREQVKEINDVLEHIKSGNDKIKEVLMATNWGVDYYQALELFRLKDAKCPTHRKNMLAYSIQQLEIPECSITEVDGHLYVDADLLIGYLNKHGARKISQEVKIRATLLDCLCLMLNKIIKNGCIQRPDIDMTSEAGWHLYRNSDGEPALYTFDRDVYMWMNAEEVELKK